MIPVVVFTNNNARIIQVDDPAPYQGLPNCAVNPDYTAVKGIPPEFWKLVDGSIQAMTDAEQLARQAEHTANGIDNDVKAAIEKYQTKAEEVIEEVKHVEEEIVTFYGRAKAFVNSSVPFKYAAAACAAFGAAMFFVGKYL